MSEAKLQQDVISLSAAISAYEKGSRWRDSLWFFQAPLIEQEWSTVRMVQAATSVKQCQACVFS